MFPMNRDSESAIQSRSLRNGKSSIILRRSLVEPATFLLLVLGWVVLPGITDIGRSPRLRILVVPALVRVWV